MIQPTAARFVSRLTNNTLALVLAGGRGERLGPLTDWRTKPAVPFGGKFRIIDFTLSNCLHSAIRKVCVLTQYKSHSLIQHLMRGWSNMNNERGEFLDIVPAQQWTDDESWFQGTADAVYQSLDIIQGYGVENVLILAGDHIYNMDYGEMLAEHARADADLRSPAMPFRSRMPPASSASWRSTAPAPSSGSRKSRRRRRRCPAIPTRHWLPWASTSRRWST